jgi:Right handed beta helix region
MTMPGLGGQQPAPMNAPGAGQPGIGVQPGVSNAVVTANKVIIFGSGGGLFVYSGTPAYGNLIQSITASAGTDPYGNSYLGGDTSYSNDPFGSYIQELEGNLVFGASAFQSVIALDPVTGTLSLQAGDAPQGAVSLGVDGAFSIGSSEVWYPPSGDTSGASDVTNINALLAAGTNVIHLTAGHYYIDAPIVIPGSQCRLTGDWWWSAVDSDNYSAGAGNTGGALITMVPAFAGSAAIEMVNSTSTQYYGVDISGITIEGNEVAAGTIYGILVDGAWGACFLRGVCIHRPPADCIRFVTDATSGFIPDAWVISECKFSASRNGNGFYAAELADSIITDCESSENALDGWYVNYGVQTRFTACKGENNGEQGFHFSGLGGHQVQYLTGCSTHINGRNGFYFDNGGPSGGGPDSTYILTGCAAQQDGQSGTAAGYGGFASNGSVARIIGTGCMAQTDSTGTHPEYGATEINASFGMCFTGCLFQGATAAVNDDGSNTHALVNQSPVAF